MMRLTIFCLLFTTLLTACTGGKKPFGATIKGELKTEYAQGFKISEIEGGKILTIYFPEDTTKSIAQLALMQKGHKAPSGITAIEVPVKRIASLSSTYMAYFLELNAINNIVAVNSSRHLHDSTMLARINNGEIRQVGKEGNFNTEIIAALNPDIIFVSPFKTGGYDAIKQLNIPLVPMTAFEEDTPLGRAEWIKMIALFVDKYDYAVEIFDNINSEYKRLKSLTSTIEQRPTVFSGKMKSGMWYVAGGKSFYAHYFADAGADYIFKDSDQRGSENIDYEVVYQQAANADFWRVYSNQPGEYSTTQLATEDHRYSYFDAYKTGNIIYCNIREKPYYETSPVKPHIMLADYIKLFHPQLLPNYEPVYYEKIKKDD